MTPKEQIVYDMLANAAERGDPCPNNCLLATAVGTTPAGASAYVNKLEARGLIQVHRSRRARVVVICDTGQRTESTAYQYSKGQQMADKLADFVAEGGMVSKAHHALGCSEQRVRQLWAQIKGGLGWLG